MNIKFMRMKSNDVVLNSFEEKIPNDVESVETLKTSKGEQIYRVKFNGLESFGYLLQEENGKGQARFIHYCEANEKKSSCRHAALAAVIGRKLGYKVELISTGATIADIESLSISKNDDDYSSLNSMFELPETVHEEETVPAPPSAPPKPVSKALTKGRDWKVEWSIIQDYLKNEGLNARLIAKIQAKRIDIHKTVSLRPMTIEPKKPTFPYQGEMLGRSLRHILNGKDLILIGDKGSGKDTLITTLSWILGLPISIYVGNKDESKESLVGDAAFRNGESTFDPSEFAKVIEYGGIVNMAELNMLVGDVTSILHSVADENRVLATPIGSIPRHEHSIIAGSMNVGEGYHGIKELNDALKDRFAILRLPYTTDFKKMIENKTGLSDLYALIFLEKVKEAIKKLMVEESQGAAANTLRGYFDAAEYFNNYGITFDTKVEVIEDYILNKIEDLDEYMAARHMVRVHAWSDFPVSPEEEEYVNGGM